MCSKNEFLSNDFGSSFFLSFLDVYYNFVNGFFFYVLVHCGFWMKMDLWQISELDEEAVGSQVEQTCVVVGIITWLE